MAILIRPNPAGHGEVAAAGSWRNRALLALKLEPLLRAKGKENESKGGQEAGRGRPKGKGSTKLPNPIAKVDTRKEVAKAASVSEGTLAKVKVIEAKAPPEAKAGAGIWAMALWSPASGKCQRLVKC
jgi:hypothetical protein